MFHNYSTDGSEFLEPFYDYYIPENKGNIYVSDPNYEEPVYLVSVRPAGKMTFPEKMSEWCLDSYLAEEEKTAHAVYEKLGFKPIPFYNPIDYQNTDSILYKDQYGKMPYLIIGETSEREFDVLKFPVSGETTATGNQAYIYDHGKGAVIKKDGDLFTCFRYSVNAIKK